MKKEYDFTQGTRGKFFRPKKIQKTLRLDEDVLKFFQMMSESHGIPYQTLINLTLRKFALEDGKIVLTPPRQRRKAG